jgi:hypothetical protein
MEDGFLTTYMQSVPIAFKDSLHILLWNTFKILPRHGYISINRQFTSAMDNNFAGKLLWQSVLLVGETGVPRAHFPFFRTTFLTIWSEGGNFYLLVWKKSTNIDTVENGEKKSQTQWKVQDHKIYLKYYQDMAIYQ